MKFYEIDLLDLEIETLFGKEKAEDMESSAKKERETKESI